MSKTPPGKWWSTTSLALSLADSHATVTEGRRLHCIPAGAVIGKGLGVEDAGIVVNQGAVGLALLLEGPLEPFDVPVHPVPAVVDSSRTGPTSGR